MLGFEGGRGAARLANLMWGWIKGFVLAGFVFAGVFKAAIDTGPDLTVSLAIALMILALVQVIKDRFLVRREALAVLGIFLLMAVPLLWTDFTPYSGEKVGRFFTLTLLAGLAPMLLVSKPNDVRNTLHAMVFIAVAAAFAALALSPELGSTALEPLEGTHIGFSRLAGMGAIVIVVELMQRQRAAAWGLMLIPLLYAPIAAGSRGPVAAIFVTVAILALFVPTRRRTVRVVNRVAIVAILGAFALFAFGKAPEAARDRYELLASQQRGHSVTVRQAVYPDAAKMILSSPIGNGWGSYQTNNPFGFDYPHNLFLEVFIEGGWIIGMLVVLGILLTFRRAFHRNAPVLLALVIYGVLNSMLSGDLNANRPMLMVIGLIYCVPQREDRAIDASHA